MRRSVVAVLAVLAIAAMPGCKRRKDPVQYVEEGGSQLAIAINVADPRAAIQLLRGFHDVENNAWRWTGPTFAVALRPPKEVPPEGARLFLEYAVPDVFLQKVPRTTLSVMVNGKALDPEVINKAGSGRVERTVPPELLRSDVITVDFSLDKFLPAGAVDQRDLGLIVSAVGLQGSKAPAPATK
ncbi:MAG: hypothetical protein HYX27_26860 [Acidobacteria bacterium]|nr:hypothetical protein [Acidobacteriota bacterium]